MRKTVVADLVSKIPDTVAPVEDPLNSSVQK